MRIDNIVGETVTDWFREMDDIKTKQWDKTIQTELERLRREIEMKKFKMFMEYI